MPARHTPEIELPPDAATADDHHNPRRSRRDAEEAAPELGMIVEPDPRHCDFVCRAVLITILVGQNALIAGRAPLESKA